MEVLSQGGLPAQGFVWQPRRESWVATVVCKASFALAPGSCVLAPTQEPLAEDDSFFEGDATKSLRAPRDLVPVKPNVDILLVGHAFAPEKRPTPSLVARLSIGEMSKAIEVFGERSIGADGSVRAATPFIKMPLVYERTAGGPQTTNPIGVQRDARGADGLVLLPNLERPGGGRSHEPIGFGPISPSWPGRRDKLGAASSFSMRDIGHAPLPEGLDLTFFNAAPHDQQVRAISPSERLVLENLHLEHALLVTSLPGLAPKAVIEGRRTGPQPLALRADTLTIDTDRGICTLAFRGSFGLESAGEAVRVVVSFEAPPVDALPKARVAAVKDKFDFTAEIPMNFRRGSAIPFPKADPQKAEPAHVAPPAAVKPSGDVPAIESPWTRSSADWSSSDSVAARGAPVVPNSPVPPPPLLAGQPAAMVQPQPQIQFAPLVQPTILPKEVVDLLWFDPESLPRMRRRPAFRQVIDELHQREVDLDADDPDAATNPQLVEDTREVFEILARAPTESADDMAEALRRCMRDDGRFVPTLVLVSGELETPFDEIGELEAAVAIAAPFAAQDDSLQEALSTAKSFLASAPAAQSASVAAILTARIDETLGRSKRVTIQLDGHRERVLLEARRYQVRNVHGAKLLRTVLPLSSGRSAGRSGNLSIPVYWPQEVTDTFPLARRFRARLVAQLHLAVDTRDGHAASLRGLALARIVPVSST